MIRINFSRWFWNAPRDDSDDFLARIHPYRNEENVKTDQIEFDLCEVEFYTESHQAVCSIMSQYLGRGDCNPLLGITPIQEAVQCVK